MYDNSKIAVASIVGHRGRTPTREFLRLASHFLFESHFCRVRRPNEKGHVEAMVGFARRNFLVPIPEAPSWEALNASLTTQCQSDLSRLVRGETASKAERLGIEQSSFHALPSDGFEARRVELATASSLSLVRFDGNDYSVPTAYAHRRITILGSLDAVRLVSAETLIATHRRVWDREQICFDPVHYLALLERKPGGLDFAKPLADWPLPECFGVLRRRFESVWKQEGIRHFIAVLRLLEKGSLAELTQAVEQALSFGVTSADGVRVVFEQSRETPVALFALEGRPHLASVQIAAPDLTVYSGLRQGGAS